VYFPDYLNYLRLSLSAATVFCWQKTQNAGELLAEVFT
jgi:hypothetical protein